MGNWYQEANDPMGEQDYRGPKPNALKGPSNALILSIGFLCLIGFGIALIQ